jgi:hypothetical protein
MFCGRNCVPHLGHDEIGSPTNAPLPLSPGWALQHFRSSLTDYRKATLPEHTGDLAEVEDQSLYFLPG